MSAGWKSSMMITLRRIRGKGNTILVGQLVLLKGNVFPSSLDFLPNDSITTEILVDILATLNHIGVFDRSEGKVPFLLLDEHDSQIKLSFLEYINNPEHMWCVCIGVPYGTALWQVGDSSE